MGGNISTLESLALMFGDGEQALDTASYNGLGAGFVKMSALEYLWLYLGDEVTQIDKRGLLSGLKKITTLKATHSDIHCLQCNGSPPFVCRDDGSLSQVLSGTCIDCSSYP